MSELCRRRFMGATAAALTFVELPRRGEAATLPSRSGLPWASGVRDTSPDTFAALRGRQLDVLNTFGPKGTWAAIRNTAGSYVSLLDPARGNRPEAIVVSYPMFPDEESPKTGGAQVWQRAAGGAFDAHHDAAATGLTRFPQRFIFRIGWEWNCCFAWACLDVGLAANYQAYFRRIVDRFRARHPDCLIDWCSVKKGRTRVSIDRWYPGGDWVDFVGHDKYDFYPALVDQATWDRDYNATHYGGPRGIGAWLAYARSKGKGLSVAEWGVVRGPDDGGGDNPVFVSRMLQFFKANAADIGFECYFNRNVTRKGWNHSLQDNPKARQAYQSFMASQA